VFFYDCFLNSALNLCFIKISSFVSICTVFTFSSHMYDHFISCFCICSDFTYNGSVFSMVVFFFLTETVIDYINGVD
jgi:hypothetical protein